MTPDSQRNFIKIGLLVLLLLMLSGCKRQSPAAQSVEAYLNALVSDDVNDVAMLTCKEWEEEAIIEYDSFQLVSPKLQDVQCSEIDQADGSATVKCTGQILATYNNEITTISLENRLFDVKNVKGDWFVCGYH